MGADAKRRSPIARLLDAAAMDLDPRARARRVVRTFSATIRRPERSRPGRVSQLRPRWRWTGPGTGLDLLRCSAVRSCLGDNLNFAGKGQCLSLTPSGPHRPGGSGEAMLVAEQGPRRWWWRWWWSRRSVPQARPPWRCRWPTQAPTRIPIRAVTVGTRSGTRRLAPAARAPTAMLRLPPETLQR